ncbi:MAG: hypothetical protein SOR31_01130 [Parvimonas sp.]|uniref:hypothetical protein n=1 Tax=Parvimonas sp. TaxID=1944660 RepID=UPI0025EB51FD|nr:hypothetical protein [Parvimonas sp.]MCI5997330.1 hypothetical protein [Parvimonas sp.]MDY3050216.1 hypothetical protein [Parvimonas sp.]
MKNVNCLSKNINPLTNIKVNKFYGKSIKKEYEKSILALDSYMLYEFNKEKMYKIDKSNDCLIYNIDEMSENFEQQDNNEIKITADLLTNSKLIDEISENFGVQNNPEIKAFDEVKYTIGNCCPVWRNPASGRGVLRDTIWYKLNKHIVEKRKQKLHPIKLRDRIKNKDFNNLNKRNSEEIFSIFNSDISWGKLISDLYLQDYFKYDWNLFNENYVSIDKIEKNDFINYVKITTTLIVQRGYRISTGYKGNILRKQDKEVIEGILNRIGLENTKCIYSKKKRIL